MFKLRRRSGEEREELVELGEQHLPGVFRYIYFWVNDTRLAEDLTLKVCKETLVKYCGSSSDEKRFSTEVFSRARQEIQEYTQTNPFKPNMAKLSFREQEVVSLKFGAMLNNQGISCILGLPESIVGKIISESLGKLKS